MRTLVIAALLAFAAPGSGRANALAAQVEIDRTLQRVYGIPIMASDVRQARLMRLLPDAADTDRAIQTALENRLLMLREVSRGGSPVPEEDAVAMRRRTWEGTLPAGFDVEATMTRAGMNPSLLEAWFRDDVRIEEYVTRRFGQAADPRRAERIDEWIRDLRRRAGIDGRDV